MLVGGKLVSGSQRWLVLGPLQLQPSEIAKLALLVCGAEVLTRRADRLDDLRAWRPVLAIFVVFAALVMKEPDLASTIVLGVIVVALLIVGGVRAKHLAQMIGVARRRAPACCRCSPATGAPACSRSCTRGTTSGTPATRSAQSLIALGSGGVNGVGLGAGRAKWFFLPERAHRLHLRDHRRGARASSAACWCSGCSSGSGSSVCRIARRAPDRFGMLLAAGVTAWIVGQAAINLGAVVGLLPVSGVPLPFLSVGGSSLVITMFGAGVVANVARQTAPAPPARRSRSAGPRRVRARAS